MKSGFPLIKGTVEDSAWNDSVARRWWLTVEIVAAIGGVVGVWVERGFLHD